MSGNTARLNSLDELKRALETGEIVGGQEMAEVLPSALRAALLPKDWYRRIEGDVFEREFSSSSSDLGAIVGSTKQTYSTDASILARIDATNFTYSTYESLVASIEGLERIYPLTINLLSFGPQNKRSLGQDDMSSFFGARNLREGLVAKDWFRVLVFTRTLTSSSYNILGQITGIEIDFFEKDIGAEIDIFLASDVLADIYGVSPSDLNAVLLSIPPSDLGAVLQTIPSVDLGAVAGGHPPGDIPATMSITQPVNIPAYIRGGASGQIDLGASITRVGYHTSMSAYIRAAVREVLDLGASIKIKSPVDLGATIGSWQTSDISASLTTQRAKDLGVIIWGWAREVIKNFSAVIRITTAAVKDLPVAPIRAVVHTHTSDKVPNLDKVSNMFYENKYLFGTQAKGIFVLNIEPIFGFFPDLHASIFAQDYYHSELNAYINVAQRQASDIGTTLTAVSPYINISKTVISPNPLKNLGASLTQIGALKSLRAILVPVHHTSTGTSDDAGFVITASSYKFLIGTSKGLFIPEDNVPVIRVSTFRNNHPTPDLRAHIQGHHLSDLGAYIKDYTYSLFAAEIDSIGPDRYRDYPAYLTPAHVSSLGASLSSFGGLSGLSASIETAGTAVGISATIISFINPLAFSVVSISTKPFANMGAFINYDQLVGCAPTSKIVGLSAFIRAFAISDDETSDLPASITALHLTKNLTAEIAGRKKTRLRILTLNFRASARSSSPLRGIIVPLYTVDSDLSATIAGMSHETDLPASITPTRYSLANVLFTATETVVNLKHPEDVKTILVSFRSKVSSYVYEEITNAVYATDRGTWAIDLRSVLTQDGLFDRDPESRERVIDDVAEFFSVDEAIRNAISLICDRRTTNLGAVISATGTSTLFGASIELTSIDRFKDMRSQLVCVLNSPDMGATINTGLGSSGYSSLSSLISPEGLDAPDTLGAEIIGQYLGDFGAEITAI